MFGLTFEKLVVIALIAALIVGPSRLPHYAQRLAETVRAVRAFLDAARERTEAETGISLEEWRAMDLRRYDPRRIVRDALDPDTETEREPEEPGEPGPEGKDVQPIPVQRSAEEEEESERADPAPAEAGPDAPEPRLRWVVVGGSSGHPKRMLVEVDDEPVDAG